MILNLQMGTVSFFNDFLSIPRVIKDYSIFVCISLHKFCFAVCWRSRCLFSFLKKHDKVIQILQRSLTKHVLCLCLDMKDIVTL